MSEEWTGYTQLNFMKDMVTNSRVEYNTFQLRRIATPGKTSVVNISELLWQKFLIFTHYLDMRSRHRKR